MSIPEFVEIASGVRTPICVDCGDTFVRDSAEIAARHDPALPLSARCPTCRERHRADRNASRLAAYATGPIGAAPWPAPGPEGGSGRLHHAVCAVCGRAIRLPFRPSGDHPVYCRACLSQHHGQ